MGRQRLGRRAADIGVELQEKLPPSRRHPLGAPRCRAVTGRDGVRRQCRRKARDGFPVCSHHGAGSRKRELAGRAQNPALASLTTGRRAKDTTLARLWQNHPELRALYDQHLNGDDLLDMRPVLAQARALSDWIINQFDPSAPEGEGGPPLAFRAIQSLAFVVRTAREMLKIEEALGPVTHAELRRLTNAVAQTIRQFVPQADQQRALAYLREELAGRDHRDRDESRDREVIPTDSP